MKFKIGDLVRHTRHPHILGVVLMVETTRSGQRVCDVLITLNSIHPTSVGTVKYLNQSYWELVNAKD